MSEGCGHTFAWWGVIPPSHCLICGRPLPPESPRIARVTTAADTTNAPRDRLPVTSPTPR